MKEIFLVRHAQSEANIGQRTAFDQKYAQLTPKGIQQCFELSELLIKEFGIVPEQYYVPVAASTYVRTMQTAIGTGFDSIDLLPLIDEAEVAHDIAGGLDVIAKHRNERWVPTETALRVGEFHDRIASGELEYEIYFTHGMFIAGFLLECDVRGIQSSQPFCSERGYVPLQAAVIKVTV